MSKNKIIMFQRGAEFYFDLGYKYIQKGKLKIALRYIEKAVELKPEDGYLQFNYAGILAELGHVDKSTEVLRHIIEKLDPEYIECYFGLGCNYLQMQKIKKAIEYFKTYLEKDPRGDFADEANELLEMLIMIKDANNDMDDEEIEKVYIIEEEAIKHLEKREYEKAAQKFGEVVEILPNAVPARNNLSLANYYLGNMDKAIELAKEVLKYEPENIHANCNLAIYYNKLNLQNNVAKYVRHIKKIETENIDYLYKISDTYGSIGKNRDAYKGFKRLMTFEPDNTLYIHYAAIAASNSKNFQEAIRLWEKIDRIDSENLITDYYIEKAIDVIEKKIPHQLYTYTYQLPKDETTRRMTVIYEFLAMTNEDVPKAFEDMELQEILYFGINFDVTILRRLIFNKFRSCKLKKSEKMLRRFLLKQEIDYSIKTEVIFLLDAIKANEPYLVNYNGEIKAISAEPTNFPKIFFENEYEQVKDLTLKNMKGLYRKHYKKEVQNIWYGFIKYSYPDMPEITNIDVWSAALEYAFNRHFGGESTQKQLAEKYQVALSTMAKKYKILEDYIKSRE